MQIGSVRNDLHIGNGIQRVLLASLLLLLASCAEQPPPTQISTTTNLSSEPEIADVIAPPKIVTQPPANVEGYVGQSASITAVITCPTTCTYKWFKNGVETALSTTNTLSFNSLVAADAGDYELKIENQMGAVTSGHSQLRVNPAPVVATAPVITSQPGAQFVVAGSTAAFIVVATGNPMPTFQWFKDGSPIGGATSSTFALVNATSNNAGAYRVDVTNSAGTVSSATVTLTVTQPPANCSAGGSLPANSPDFESQWLSNNSSFVAAIPAGNHLQIRSVMWTGYYGACSASIQCQNGTWYYVYGACAPQPPADTGGGGG